jgi:hypothetical protein
VRRARPFTNTSPLLLLSLRVDRRKRRGLENPQARDEVLYPLTARTYVLDRAAARARPLYAERGSSKYEKAEQRWLERYLTEHEPRLRHFAEVVLAPGSGLAGEATCDDPLGSLSPHHGRTAR